jgi:hypothetical protein
LESSLGKIPPTTLLHMFIRGIIRIIPTDMAISIIPALKNPKHITVNPTPIKRPIHIEKYEKGKKASNILGIEYNLL